MPEGSVSFGLALPGVSRIESGHRDAPRRRLLGAAGLSLLFHAIVLAALLLGLKHRARVVEAADTPAIVELVMSPPGGRVEAPAVAPQPLTEPPARPQTERRSAQSPPNPAPQQEKTETPSAAAAAQSILEPPPPALAETTAVVPDQPSPESSLPPPAQAPPVAQTSPAEIAIAKPIDPTPSTIAPAAPEQPPVPRRAQQAPQFSLGAIASDTNALVTGDLLVPPSVDPKFRNRKPSYPREAAQRGEHGAVLLQIHVSPDGLVRDADIAKSSGYRLLDDAARDAVLSWHFLPAVKNGQPVPFAMPLRIVFDLF